MRAVDLIKKKRDGFALDQDEIEAFVAGATCESWPDYQLSALLMAIVLRGMTPQETAWLTQAMVRSGEQLDLSDLPGVKVDKHSTGGVGDKTSLIVAPLAAACGVVVPMMSGRGLGHTGGTLDKLEAIPGFRTGLTLQEFRKTLANVGCAMISQTREIAPADKKLYAIRDVTATIESIPLISASIMSKKIAEGVSALIMDVKCGRGAFMKNRNDARALAQSLVAIGNANDLRTQAIVSAMDAPLGRAVGNALEVIECIETLKGRGPTDLERLSIDLTARMLQMADRTITLAEAEQAIRSKLSSGRGLEKFIEMVEQQSGDPRVVDDYSRFPAAARKTVFCASRSGYVIELDAELIGRAAMLLGAGRDRVSDRIDPGVGVVLGAKPGDFVEHGDALVELHYQHQARLDAALPLLSKACRIEESASPSQELILENL